MKKQLTILMVLSTITFSSVIKADEVTLPVITRPAILQEGTQRELTQAQIAELLPWAKDSKAFLTGILEDIQGISSIDKIERLVDGIKATVGDSAPKNSELLMRYALNRGLILEEILSQETDADSVGSLDARIRVLVSSINMAIKYYDTDMSILQKKTRAPFVIFGLDYFEFLSELNKSIFDASAQYKIQRTALEWLQWDLYRDVNNMAYAPQIVKINHSLKTFPDKRLTDAQSIANIRLMKKTAQQLKVKDTLAKLEQEKRAALIATDAQAKAEYEAQLREEARKREQEEVDRMRSLRTAIDIEKVRIMLPAVNSTNWSQRQQAVEALANIPGNDVNLVLIKRYFIETDSDVMRVLSAAVFQRLDAGNRYLLKNETRAQLEASIVKYVNDIGKPSNWFVRRNTVYVLRYVKTIESYRILSEWRAAETDSDVIVALKGAISDLESALR